MPALALRRTLMLLAALAAGCQATPPASPPAGSLAPAPSPPGPAAPPSPAPSPTPVVTSTGAVTRLDVPGGQRAAAVTASARTLLAVVSNASDQPATIALDARAEGARSLTSLRPAPPAAAWPFPTSNEAAERALAAPRGPARRVLAATERAVGHRDTFWINTGAFTADTDVRRTAVLKRVSPRAYLYVDAEAPAVSDAELDAFIAAFEEQVYPRVTALFGPEARPGIDGDDRIFLVFSPAVHGFERQTDLLAYFWAPDVVPGPAAGSHSNQKEALFLSTRLFGASPLLAFGTLAHELQHLINFTRKGPRLGYAANEATWLDEGLSMLAMEAAGYGLAQGERLVASAIAEYQARPEAYSLTDWAGNPTPAFGQSYLFVRYLVDRHGEAIVRELLETDLRGIEALDSALRRRGDSFAGLFQAWAIANAFSDAPASAGTPYRYDGLRLAGTYGGVELPGFRTAPAEGAIAPALRPWGTAYHRFTAGQAQPWRLELEAPAAGRALCAGIAVP